MGRVGIVAAVLALMAAPLAAQESEQLKKEVEQLRKEVDALKQEKAAPAPATPAESGKAMMKMDDNETVLDILMRETKINGFVDAGFVYNLNRPDTGLNGGVTGPGTVRAFDQRSRSFYLHNAQLNFNRAATKELITGYNIELSFGSDANVFAAGGHGGEADYFDVQEANVQILAPLGNGLDIRVGKFATLAGAEVIESKDNFNYSRSLPFLFAIPFTHTGVRATYAFDDKALYSATLGINNGWDNVEDNNDGKTLEFQFFANPIPWLKLYANFYYGAEKSPGDLITFPPFTARDNSDKRMLIDLIATVTDIPGLPGFSAYLNVDIGEEEASDSTSTATAGDDAEWLGFAVAAKYVINEDWAVAARFSTIDDDGAFRTGGFTDPITTLTESNKISEITLTVERQISKDTRVRLEWRMDMSDEDIFLDKSKLEDSQSTLGAEVILVF